MISKYVMALIRTPLHLRSEQYTRRIPLDEMEPGRSQHGLIFRYLGFHLSLMFCSSRRL